VGQSYLQVHLPAYVLQTTHHCPFSHTINTLPFNAHCGRNFWKQVYWYLFLWVKMIRVWRWWPRIRGRFTDITLYTFSVWWLVHKQLYHLLLYLLLQGCLFRNTSLLLCGCRQYLEVWWISEELYIPCHSFLGHVCLQNNAMKYISQTSYIWCSCQGQGILNTVLVRG
jgi:hypothetical protein